MADLSITLRNLLKNLNYQYAMASKQNAQNIANSAKNAVSNNTTAKTAFTSSSTTTTATTNTSASTANTASASTTAKTSSTASSLSKLLASLKSASTKSTSAINNTATITNDMELEFFKSNKNAVMTDIYNKINNNLVMTAADLSNFKAQVAKLSSDEQNLWKSEIAKIETKIETKIFENTSASTPVNNTAQPQTTKTEPVQTAQTPAQTSTSTQNQSKNGFVNNVLYQDGEKYTGVYSNGLYYQNGVLASGNVNGKVYVNGQPLNGVQNGILYQNGAYFNGVQDGKMYQNGLLADGVVNGKFYKDGVLSSGTFLGKTYVNGVLETAAATTTAATTATTPAAPSTPATSTSSSSNQNSNNNTATTANIVTKKTDSNGNILGYDENNNLVYLEKTVNGKKYVYDDELAYLNKKTLTNLKGIDDSVLTDRLLADIEIVKNAEAAGLAAGAKGTSAYQKAYDASVKAQMIKTTSNMTNTAGEVVEKYGSLYVNDGNKLVKLNISAETYLELFPPVERYDINQNSILDCYFVSGCLTDMQKNPTAYAQLLQMFSEDSNGNITVKFAGSLSSYPVTFKNGQLQTLDGMVDGVKVNRYNAVTGAKGAQMLEQAYAIAKFSKASNENVNTIDIDETISTINNGWQYDVYSEVLGIKSKMATCDKSNVTSYLNSIANDVNNGKILFSFASYGKNSSYGISSGHAYSVEKIDTANKLIYITNPSYAGETIAVPFSEFANVAYNNNKVYMNIGYINS